MPNKTRKDLQHAVHDKTLEPLYLLYGAEDYLRDAAARAITELALRDAPLREFNEISYSLANTEIQQALAAAEQLPMLAERRVVNLRDVQRLREADEEAVTRYLARPSATSIVIFVADDLDKRRRLTKILLEKCYAVEFAPLAEGELMQYARQRLREAHATMDDRTLAHLVGLVGSDVRTLSHELQKLAVAAIGTGPVTLELVDELVGRSRELSNFELSDHLLTRQRARAWETLRNLLADGSEPVMLLGLLASHYHRLALAKELMANGAPREEVFRLVAIPYSKREDFLSSARRADAAQLEHSLARIAAADLAIKTSQGTPRLQLEILVSELTA